MAKWRISNKTSGQNLGEYEAADAAGALEAMARDAGYKSFADACEAVGANENWQREHEMIVTVA